MISVEGTDRGDSEKNGELGETSKEEGRGKKLERRMDAAR